MCWDHLGPFLHSEGRIAADQYIVAWSDDLYLGWNSSGLMGVLSSRITIIWNICYGVHNLKISIKFNTLWNILDQLLRHCSPPSSAQQLLNQSSGNLESIPGCIKVVAVVLLDRHVTKTVNISFTVHFYIPLLAQPLNWSLFFKWGG